MLGRSRFDFVIRFLSNSFDKKNAIGEVKQEFLF